MNELLAIIKRLAQENSDIKATCADQSALYHREAQKNVALQAINSRALKIGAQSRDEDLARIEAEARKLVAALFTELDEEEATDVILAAFPHGAPAWVLAYYDAEHGDEG